MNLINANIDNITQLWTTVGMKTATFHSEKNIEYCTINDSEWPNRLWFTGSFNVSIIERAREILLRSKVPMKVSSWHNSDFSDELFVQYNFAQISEQTGMSVKLTSEYESDPGIELRKVSTQQQATLWAELFIHSFGYKISQKVIVQSSAEVNYFVCYCNNSPVGVCLLYHNNSQIIGIHAMGIIPEMRRRGFAEEILRKILTNSKYLGFSYAVLQASKTGKPLYHKYGFTEEFTMKNYQLKV